MKFDKTTVIGLVICTILLFAWTPVCQYFGWIPAPEETAETAAPAAGQSDDTKPAPAPADNAAAKAANHAGEAADNAKQTENTVKETAPVLLPADYVFGNEFVEMTIAADGSGISKTRFLQHRHNNSDDKITVCGKLFKLDIPGAAVRNTVFTKKDENTVSALHTIALDTREFQLEQIYSIKDNYIVNCHYRLINPGKDPITIKGAVVCGNSIAPWHALSGDKVRTISHTMDYLTAAGDLESADGDDDDEDYFLAVPVKVQWAAVSNKYFCSMFKSADGKDFTMWQETPRQKMTDSAEKEHNILTIGAAMPEITLHPGTVSEFEFACCTGPKKADTFAQFAPEGESAIHLAWGPLNYLARLLMWLLNLFHTICGSYGVSIILLTILVRALFYPLTSKGNESMRKMQKVQPLFKELKEKYKDDPQLLNQKMTELYRKEGINPLAGCFPILLQIPIFFALYAMLDNAIALRHVSFLWAKNLAAADTVCRIPLGFTDLPLNPLVLAMTALMLIQQRMTPMSADPAQKKMMMFMPVIMLVFLYDLPSGLTLYWTISNIFSIIQLWLQRRRNQALEAAANQSK